jgi:hypothetical protein
VMSWGWVMLVLGLCGLVCTLSLRKSRHDPSKAFLVVYFASIAFLVLVCLVLGYGYGFFFLSYLFSALALPVSIFGAMALIGVVDAVVRATSMKHLHTSEFMACRMSSAPARRRVRALSLVALVVVVIASSNVANYGGESAIAYPFDAAFRIDATIPLSDGNLRINYVMVFRYAKSIDAPSNDVYNALRWIRDYSSEESHVVAFLDIPPDRQNLANVIRRAFPDISAREFTDGTRFASSLMRSPIEFRQKALNASGGDTYVVIGVYSWLQEKWANSTLEGRFLEYAAQGPDLFPQVYFSHDVHVFRINANPNIDSFRMPCVRTTAIWNHATTRSGSKRPSADQSADPGNLCTRPGDEPLNDREAETSAFKPPRS